jgi:hypothetical protein
MAEVYEDIYILHIYIQILTTVDIIVYIYITIINDISLCFFCIILYQHITVDISRYVGVDMCKES